MTDGLGINGEEADSGAIWLPNGGSGLWVRFRGADSLCDHRQFSF